ncbi:MAG: radical SAM protein [Proteobacteria bacterium]|nr:radical SAM protein [Pseudomonadota bacterium]
MTKPPDHDHYTRPLIKPRLLSFITTFKCTAACRNCCFRCSPARTESLPLESIRRIINEAAIIPEINVIVFTGGECFIERTKLIESINHASSRGYITRCVSNAYWATDIVAAKKSIAELKEAGLAEINFSVGDNHLKFVPMRNVRNAAVAACEAGLTTVINIELFNGSRHRNKLESVFTDLRRSFSKLIVNCGLWIDRGDDIRIRHHKKYSLTNDVRARGCKSIISSLSVTPDEKLLACCGLLVEDVPEMVLGDLKKMSLSDLVNGQREDLLKCWIHLEGPQAVLDSTRSFDRSIRLKDTYVHPCQACRDLYKLKNRDAVVKACSEAAPKIYDRLLAVERFNECFAGIKGTTPMSSESRQNREALNG